MRLRIASCVLGVSLLGGAVAVASFSQQPTSNPSSRRGEHRNDPADGPPTMSPEDWEEVVSFLAANSPNRLEMYREWEQRSAGGPQAGFGRMRLLMRVQRILRLEDDNKSAYGAAVKQFQIEDQILGAIRTLRDKPEDADAEAKLQAAIKEYARISLDERSRRIAGLREALKAEEDRLKADQASPEKLEQALQERFMREVGRYMGDPPPDDERRESTTRPRWRD